MKINTNKNYADLITINAGCNMSASAYATPFDWAKPFSSWITGGFLIPPTDPATSVYSAPVDDDYLDALVKPKKAPACRHSKLPKDSCFEKLPCPDCQKLVKI